MTTGTFTKINGQWAVKVPRHTLNPGADVTVVKKDGSRKHVTVGKRLAPEVYAIGWSGNAAPARRPATVDHEDCLSFSGCLHHSPRCPYHR